MAVMRPLAVLFDPRQVLTLFPGICLAATV